MPDRERNFDEELEQARTASGSQLEALLFHRGTAVLEALLENPSLKEQQLVVLLSRRDLPRAIVASIAQNREWMKSYPLKVAVVKHPQAPRHLALPLLRFLYLFDLKEVAASPTVPAEIRKLAEEAVLSQREGIALGQRLALARQGTRRIAAGLLLDPEAQVVEAALSNPFLTEQDVAQAVLRAKQGSALTSAVLAHRRWPASYAVKLALLRSESLSLAHALQILPELAAPDLEDLKDDRRVPQNIRKYVAGILKTRKLRVG